MQNQVGFLAGVVHFKNQARGDDLPHIAHLAATFGVERRTVQHHGQLLVSAVTVGVFQKCITGNQTNHAGRGFHALIGQKFRRFARLLLFDFVHRPQREDGRGFGGATRNG